MCSHPVTLLSTHTDGNEELVDVDGPTRVDVKLFEQVFEVVVV